jgi:Cu/Ag efflux protein CusF
MGRNTSMAWMGVALAFALAACGGPASDGHPGRGIVTGVDAAARTVSLDHGDIPGLMKAMTMTFEVAPDVSLEGIEVGSEVDFRVKHEDGVYTVTMIGAASSASSGSESP